MRFKQDKNNGTHVQRSLAAAGLLIFLGKFAVVLFLPNNILPC